MKNATCSDHIWTFRYHFAWHIHHITLHYTYNCSYTTLHYATLSTSHSGLHYTTLRYATLRYATLHYPTPHYPTLPHTTPHYPTPHHTTPHYTTLHYTDCTTSTMTVCQLQLQLQVRYTTLHPAVVGEVTDQETTATIVTIPKNPAPTTFQSISGFALPSVIHHNQALLLQVSDCQTSGTPSVRYCLQNTFI